MRSLRENIGKLSTEDREGEKERESTFTEHLLNCVPAALPRLFPSNSRVAVLTSCSRL